MKFPKEFIEYLRNNTLVEIKGGTSRETFLQIWMVSVDGRVFARSWNKSKRSWFTEIEKTGVGQIKFGDAIIDIKGQKLSKNAELTRLINSRYLEKYNQVENLYYAKGITQPEYEDFTMEFFYDNH